jgi:hypothetical protein
MLCDQNEQELERVQEVLNGTRSGPRVKITQDVRDHSANLGVSEEEALRKCMEETAVEFFKEGISNL